MNSSFPGRPESLSFCSIARLLIEIQSTTVKHILPSILENGSLVSNGTAIFG